MIILIGNLFLSHDLTLKPCSNKPLDGFIAAFVNKSEFLLICPDYGKLYVNLQGYLDFSYTTSFKFTYKENALYYKKDNIYHPVKLLGDRLVGDKINSIQPVFRLFTNYLDKQILGVGNYGIVYGYDILLDRPEMSNQVIKIYFDQTDYEIEKSRSLAIGDEGHPYIFLPKSRVTLEKPIGTNIGSLSLFSHVFDKGYCISHFKSSLAIDVIAAYHNIILGMFFLWDKGYIHGDIKFDNILFDNEDKKIKFIDIDLKIIGKKLRYGIWPNEMVPVILTVLIMKVDDIETYFLENSESISSVNINMDEKLRYFVGDHKIYDILSKYLSFTLENFLYFRTKFYALILRNGNKAYNDLYHRIDIFQFFFYVILAEFKIRKLNLDILEEFAELICSFDKILSGNDIHACYDKIVSTI